MEQVTRSNQVEIHTPEIINFLDLIKNLLLRHSDLFYKNMFHT